MSTTYDNTNRFVLFKNDKKQDERSSDLNGTINVNGVDHFFDAWVTVENGKLTRINGKIGKVKNKQADKPRENVSSKTNFDDDNIPF